MKWKRFISAITTITMMFSGAAFSGHFSNSYNKITAVAFSVEESYSSSASYTASCILGGLVDLETGNHSASVTKYSDVITRNYAYEQLAENVMEDKGLVITSAMWDTFSKSLGGKLSAIDTELRQEQVYEAFLMDYLTFSEGSTENSTLLDKAGDFADKTMKYENKIFKKLLDKGIAADEKELKNLINNSDSLNDSKIVEAIGELKWEKKLVGYTKLLDDVTEVATNAKDYLEALTKAMALKEVNDERVEFLKAMAEKASDNEAFQCAVENIIETIESSYGDIALKEGVETMGNFAWDKCWGIISKNIPCFSTFKTAHDAMNYFFDSDSMAENNIRIIMQYTAGQYAKQVLMSAYPAHATTGTDETASALVEAYKNYIAYQDYSSEWAKKFVEAVPFSSSTTVDEWLSDLNSDINYCNKCIEFAGKYTEIYNKAVDNINDNTTFNGHTYQLFDYNMTWTEAEKYCEELGGHLVTISDDLEWNFVVNLFEKSSKTLLWLGAKYDENEKNWKWVDNTSFSYTLWDTKAGEPNRCYRNSKYESYVMTYKIANPSSEVSNSDAYKWNDIFESGIFPGEENFFHTNNYCFICEWDSPDVQTENFDINTMILDGHSYKLVPIKKSWTDAEAYAEQLGGHLVTINSSSEQVMIEKMITRYTDSHFWLGGYYSTDIDEWKWIDNTDFDYNNWQKGQPDNYWENEFYIEIYPSDAKYTDYHEEFGKWNDSSNDAVNDENNGNYFIIEWEHLGYTMLGDIDKNESISISDAVLMQKYLLGTYSFSKTQWELADMNKDGRVDVFDMCLMRREII